MSSSAGTTMSSQVSISDDELIQAFLAATDSPPVREPGWLDISQIAGVWGCSERAAHNRLKKSVDAGKLEQREVYDPANGRNRLVWRPV